MEMKRFTVPFEIKADGDANSDMGLFEGYGSVFGNIDLGGDVVEGGAFTKSLQEWNAKNELPAMYGFHDSSNPIGDWLEMAEDEKGLRVRGKLWIKGESRIEQAVVAHNIMKGTGPKGLSIGYRVRDFEDVEFDGGYVRRLKEIDLFEVSVVGFAMNPKASVTGVKSFTDEDGHILTKREVEKVLRDSGLSKRQALAFLAGGYKAIERDAKSDVKAPQSDSEEDLSGVIASLNSLSTILKG